MKRAIFAVALISATMTLVGCNKRSDVPVTAASQVQSQTQQAIPQPVAQPAVQAVPVAQPQLPAPEAGQVQSSAVSETTSPQPLAQSRPFTYLGVHAGMTVAEVKAATEHYRGKRVGDAIYDNQMQCGDNYGGPNHDTRAVECAFETDSGGVKLFFFRKRLFYIRWRCADNDECVKEKALMKAHFGKPQSNRVETHQAQVGAFREQTVRWHSRQESASVGGGQFEVLNYDFAPSFVQRQ
jgi:uncharacterized lipoprotein NlpE involved in copper resistance